jgi:diaminopimelate epimerase
MNFVKVHGTGNDFVVVRSDAAEADWSGVAQTICDRHFGVGSDGLILALPSVRCDLRMRMFNPDGTEAEMCGNGIRCLAKYAVEAGIVVPHDGSIVIETLAGDLTCELRLSSGRVERVRVAMGRPRLRPADVPALVPGSGPVQGYGLSVDGATFPATCLSMGNPHAVHFTDTPVDEFALARVGPLIEHHPAFPKRVNFEIVNQVEFGVVRARVWERGAGETLACGTGACAIGVASALAGISAGTTHVMLPGGALDIEWDGAGEVYLTGPAVEVYRGEWLGVVEPETVATGAGRR